MMGTPSNEREDCFWQADPNLAVGELVRVVREVRPQVAVTYDERGGYGHPDHIQAHRVTVAALAAAADPDRYPDAGPPWAVSKLYYTSFPVSLVRQAFETLKQMGEEAPFGFASIDELTFGDPDELVTTQIDGWEFLEAKKAAMRAHRTQISVDGPFYALSNNLGQRIFGYEFFRLVQGPPPPAGQREEDLFAGVVTGP
jgi:N-acetyl-1-D-myo-inositol-2-amino-2-deoxy-alpha-D-glucopyranoside deacetylase